MRGAGERRQGFTLIELSIVLVVIGLVVGGVLVGGDMIRSAGERAQITQIESYNRAVNVFRAKYNALPGDMNTATASQFGFSPRSGGPGMGDANGVIEGNWGGGGAGYNCGICYGAGETWWFWVDLTSANGMKINLIEGNFVYGTFSYPPAITLDRSNWWNVFNYFPLAKIGQGDFIYVWSGGINGTGWPFQGNGVNYYGISAVNGIGTAGRWGITSTPGLTVRQAYDIDKKLDDGLPQSGVVTAMYLDDAIAYNQVAWAAGGGIGGASPGTAAFPSATTCYDNGGNAAVPMAYSLSQNSGNGMNCGLSFKF